MQTEHDTAVDVAEQRPLFDELVQPASDAPASEAGADTRAAKATQAEAAATSALLEQDRQRWATNPLGAFASWKASQRVSERKYADHSVDQYTSMFGHYMSWLQELGLGLQDAREEHLDLFLGQMRGRVTDKEGRLKPAAPSTRHRYLQLLDKVYTHLRLIELAKENPAKPLLDLTRHQAAIKPPPRVLSIAQQDAYISTCLALNQAQLQRLEWIRLQAGLTGPSDATPAAATDRPACRAESPTVPNVEGLPNEPAAPPWVVKRDLALRLLFLATGITVQELRRLQPGDVVIEPAGGVADVEDGNGDASMTLDVAAHHFVPARRAPVAGSATQALLAWREHLLRMCPHAKLLFPARKVALNFDDMVHDLPISSSEAYLCVQPVLDHVAPGPRQGPQTLRNSFMLRQIYDGAPFDRIMAWTGLASTESLHRIKMLVPIRADGVRPS